MNEPVRKPAALFDNKPLIAMTQKIVSAPENNFSFTPYDGGIEAERLDFRSVKSREKKAYIVTSKETALELGSPSRRTSCMLLWTMNKGIVREGVWIAGKNFSETGKPAAELLLAVITEVPPALDPGSARFRSILNLSNRIPGYMARSVPGRLWIRISSDLLGKGFTPLALGQSLIYAFHDAIPDIGAVTAVIAAGDRGLVEAFDPVYNLERVFSGKNRKLSLEASGVIECENFSCSSCNEKESCDIIREIITIKKSAAGRGEI